VTMLIPAQPCTFTLAEAKAGVTFKYQVKVEGQVPGVVAKSQDSGQCSKPDASDLIVFGRITGIGQNYCICDTGLCMPPANAPVTLLQGTYDGTYDWDGVNWNGPSDTNNPKGQPFPVGIYQMKFSAKGNQVAPMGTGPFEVHATLQFELTP